MKYASIETTKTSEGEIGLTFRTALDYGHVNALWKEIFDFVSENRPRSIVLDIDDVKLIDSAGISLLRLLSRHCRTNGIQLRFRSFPPSAEYVRTYLETEPVPMPSRTPFSVIGLISSLGLAAQGLLLELRDLTRFIGDLVISSLSSLYRPRRFRWRETLYYAQLCGSDAMPIIFLLSFLLGLVMAFQAAIQLRQFGANIYVADLVSLALTRELGPVFTAVILAGRSGSAFAAEIGTMKVSEEVDALKVMGFNITEFLVVPKVFALAVCGPLLTMWANVSGILGGIVVGILGLDVTASGFIEEMYSTLTLTDLGTGLIKSLAFSVLVAAIGCFRGLQAHKGADSVGRQTTSAVVSGIFLIILADSIFTVAFHIFNL